MSDPINQDYVDFDFLKRHARFEYAQVFQVDSIESPTEFDERRVPAEVALPRTDQSMIVTRRAMMRLQHHGQRRWLVIPKEELLQGWEFNLIVTFLQNRQIRLVLFLFSREDPLNSIELDKLSRALR